MVYSIRRCGGLLNKEVWWSIRRCGGLLNKEVWWSIRKCGGLDRPSGFESQPAVWSKKRQKKAL